MEDLPSEDGNVNITPQHKICNECPEARGSVAFAKEPELIATLLWFQERPGSCIPVIQDDGREQRLFHPHGFVFDVDLHDVLVTDEDHFARCKNVVDLVNGFLAQIVIPWDAGGVPPV